MDELKQIFSNFKDAFEQFSRIQTDISRTYEEITQASKNIEKVYEEKTKVIDPIRDEVKKLLEQPLPEVPKVPELSEPPRPDFPKDKIKMLSALSFIALIGGAAAGDAQAGLQAINGMLAGFVNGSISKYEAELQRWKNSTANILKKYEIEVDSYNRILADRKLRLDEKLAKIEIEAAKYGDRLMLEATKIQNLESILNILASREKAYAEMIKAARGLLNDFNKMRLELMKIGVRAREAEKDPTSWREYQKYRQEELKRGVPEDEIYNYNEFLYVRRGDYATAERMKKKRLETKRIPKEEDIRKAIEEEIRLRKMQEFQ